MSQCKAHLSHCHEKSVIERLLVAAAYGMDDVMVGGVVGFMID